MNRSNCTLRFQLFFETSTASQMIDAKKDRTSQRATIFEITHYVIKYWHAKIFWSSQLHCKYFETLTFTISTLAVTYFAGVIFMLRQRCFSPLPSKQYSGWHFTSTFLFSTSESINFYTQRIKKMNKCLSMTISPINTKIKSMSTEQYSFTYARKFELSITVRNSIHNRLKFFRSTRRFQVLITKPLY